MSTTWKSGIDSSSAYDTGKLTKDTVKYLPINWSAAQIQNVIDTAPHDLNGFKLMFLFVVPEGYEAVDSEYALDLENSSITFNNFINGTLAVAGDNVTEEELISRKTDAAIEDPVNNDGLNVNKFFVNFFSSIDSPEQIDDIVSYEEDRENAVKSLRKIIIKGTSFNDDLSVVVFDQNTCQVIVKGLSFESSLKANTLNANEIDLKYANPLPSPSLEKLLIYWPLEKDLLPIVNGNFSTVVTDKKAEMIYNNVLTVGKYIDDNIDGYVMTDEYLAQVETDLEGKIDTPVDVIKNTSKEELTKAFIDTNESLINKTKIDCSLSGATCTSLIITLDKIICANIGNTRAILARFENGCYNSVNLSRDHKPTESDEIKRIISEGGLIKQLYDKNRKEYIGPERIWLKNSDIPGLSMSRTFGDYIAHTVGVINIPEINIVDFTGGEKFIVVASDSIWQYIDSDECIEIIKDYYEKNMDAIGALNSLVSEAIKRWKKQENKIEDITAVVIFFE